ncbi:MAG TPA: NAD-dependent deacylase [Burkholderiaceae bacterium]|nr:NAD-dependent deacylase [Burkholderiaceae bacterium]
MTEPPAPNLVADLRERIARAGSLCVFTGAGMSAESGIPTFRDANTSGFWTRYRPEQLASPEGFRADPALVWNWYAERRLGVRAAEPNAGHLALGDYARRHPGRLTVVTQNVDDLHQRAGCPDTLRLHGDILRDAWMDPCRKAPACGTERAVPGTPPRCADCGNLLRPGVVWFGEMLQESHLQAAEQAARECDVLLVVGTSGAVWPAAGLAGLARRAGACVVIINPHDSEIDHEAHFRIADTAARSLPLLLAGI